MTSLNELLFWILATTIVGTAIVVFSITFIVLGVLECIDRWQNYRTEKIKDKKKTKLELYRQKDHEVRAAWNGDTFLFKTPEFIDDPK